MPFCVKWGRAGQKILAHDALTLSHPLFLPIHKAFAISKLEAIKQLFFAQSSLYLIGGLISVNLLNNNNL